VVGQSDRSMPRRAAQDRPPRLPPPSASHQGRLPDARRRPARRRRRGRRTRGKAGMPTHRSRSLSVDAASLLDNSD